MHNEGDVVIGQVGEKWDQSVMRLNVQRRRLLANIRNNIRRPLAQLKAWPVSPHRVAIVGSGWSLADTYEELRQLYFDGVKIIALNGSAAWLMERNLKPSMHIILDARPANVEFVRDPIPKCKYYFASQVDPSLFDVCEDRDVTIFHAIAEDAKVEIARLDDHYDKSWFRIPPAGTVGLTSILLMRVLGFPHQHLFGIDSCYEPKTRRHHAFAQPLNEGEGTALFTVGGTVFECSSWQASQYQSFLDLMRLNGGALDLTIHGEGLLASIVRFGGELPTPQAVGA